MTPFINQTKQINTTELQAEATTELLQWVWGPFNFERLVIISLILQFILFFLSPFRKSTANGMILNLIWSAYLLADWVSYYSIGLVLNGESGRDTNHLHILWGSLLLAHISGPDTISVLEMEDHQQWSRTALKFGTIAYSIARVTSKTFSHTFHKPPKQFRKSINVSHEVAHKLLYGPTILLLVIGIIKSIEKIATLIFNRTIVFQDHVVKKIHVNPNNAMRTHGAVLVKVDKKLRLKRRKEWKQFDALRNAYELFHVFKGCYVDFMFDFEDGGCSIRDYFFDLSPEDAFQVIEIELNLMYDVFYTKASNFRKLAVRFARYLMVILEVIAFGCLASSQLDDISNWFDVPITYILVLGALFMDTIATLRIIFSIRAIVHCDDDMLRKWLEKTMGTQTQSLDHDYDDDDDYSFRGRILNKMMILRRRTWGEYSSSKEIPYMERVRRIFFRRWSESIPQFNFIDYCIRRQPRKLQSVYHILGVKEKIHKATYVSYVWFNDYLRDFIFDELKTKAIMFHQGEVYPRDVKWIDVKELDKCILIWHIATDFCWTDLDDEVDHTQVEYRKWSKTLSDYLLCILIQHPQMMKQPEIGLMGKIRLEYACEKIGLILKSSNWVMRNSSKLHGKAVHRLFEHVKRNLVSSEMYGVIYEGFKLAEELKEKGSEKWKMISQVWMELLCLTAVESKPSAHIRTLNRGGELFTLVWLLMIHLGIDSWGKEQETPANRTNL